MAGDLIPVGKAAQKQVEHARLTIQPVSGGSKTLDFLLNPYQFRVHKRAGWRTHIGPDSVGGGTAEWGGTTPRMLELDVVLDASDREDGSVLPTADDLLACCEPPAGARGKTSAPRVRFSWGKAIQFDAVMSEVSVTFTEFWPSGVPFRAEATITLQELTRKTVPQNPTSGGLVGRRACEVVAGDTLASIAQRELGNPERWRELADWNSIDDPMRLEVGSLLSVPARQDLVATAALRSRAEVRHGV